MRWATAADAAAIASIHVESWGAAYRGLLPDRILDSLSVEARTSQWLERLRDGGERAHTLVAERLADGAIAGFCTLALPSRDPAEPADVAEVPALYLRPALRRSGIGTALADAALDVMRSRGFREAILWMLEGNAGADAFYARTGWRRDGGTRGSQYYPDEPALAEVRFRRPL